MNQPIDALLAQAARHMEQGQTNQALALAQQALNAAPNHPTALHLVGILLAQAGQPVSALEHMKKSLETDEPPDVDTDQCIINYALLLRHQDRPGEAEPHLHTLLDRDPDHPQGNLLFGQILAAKDDPAAAVPYLQKAVEQDGGSAEPCYRLGRLLDTLDDPVNADMNFRTAIAREPENGVAHSAYGLFLLGQGHPDEAAPHLALALRYTPENQGDLLYNLGNARMAEGRLDEAAACYRKSISINPDNPESHAHLGFALLSQGHYQEGFSEYSWRFQAKNFPTALPPGPLWDGESLEGKSILLVAEQGYGDGLQFLRYVPLVKQQSGRLYLQIHSDLKDLAASLPGIDAIVTSDEPLPDYDCIAPLMSLPGIVGTTVETIPADVPYLLPNSQKVAKWRDRLAQVKGLKVGVVWKGNPDQHKNKVRSCPIEALTPLIEIPGVHLYSLQKDARGEPLNLPHGIINLGREFTDFSDTAAAIANLDLVISVCTSVAHLTGALGKPLWVMLAYAPDWRWMAAPDTSPWYPSARLFRQEAIGDWNGVVDRVVGALKNLAGT